MIIRTATIDDLPQIAAVESECFPPAEAATKEEFADRLIHYANHFWLMFDEQNDNKLVAFVDGFVTNEPDLTTCKDALIHYYAKFGFQNEGVTDKSVHGDAVWNQMRLTF